MQGKIRFAAIFAFVIISACFITFQITYRETDEIWQERVSDMIATDSTEISESLASLSQLVSDNYLYEVKNDTVIEGALSGLVLSLPDNFSMYLSKSRYQDYITLMNSSSNTGVGVSTLYDSSLDGLYVVNVYKGSPAEMQGLVPGDLITAVNGVSVKQLGYYKVMRELGGGLADTQVVLTVKRADGSSFSTALMRGIVNTDSITGERLEADIGLIRISSFNTGDEETFKGVLQELITKGCDKFVLDVRNNPGGNIETISRILDFLLGDGPLFTVTDKKGATNTVTSDTNSSPYPLAVLINKGTVCGAEVFAACLGEQDAAQLVGTTTYGKASTQSMYTLPDGDAVSLSSTLYTPASGKSFDGVGVAPDIEAALSVENQMRFTTLPNAEDNVLLTAIEYLKTIKVDTRD